MSHRKELNFFFLFCFYYHHHHPHSTGTTLQRNSVSPADREKYRPPRSPLDMENDSKRRKEDKLTHVSKINFLPPQREFFFLFVCSCGYVSSMAEALYYNVLSSFLARRMRFFKFSVARGFLHIFFAFPYSHCTLFSVVNLKSVEREESVGTAFEVFCFLLYNDLLPDYKYT